MALILVLLMFFVVLPIWRYVVKTGPAQAESPAVTVIEKKVDMFMGIEVVDWDKPPIWAYR